MLSVELYKVVHVVWRSMYKYILAKLFICKIGRIVQTPVCKLVTGDKTDINIKFFFGHQYIFNICAAIPMY